MFGFMKINKTTARHGATLTALKFKVEKVRHTFKTGEKEMHAFKVECEGFITSEVDASTKESLTAAVKEAIASKKLFTYKTPFRVSPLAQPQTGLASCGLLERLQAGLSCLVAHAETEAKSAGGAEDILGLIGLTPEDLV